MSLSTNTFGQYLFGDLLPRNILEVTEDKYLQAIQQFVALENAFVSQLTGTLCDRGTQVQVGFLNGPGGRMQKITKRGGAEKTRSGQRWWCGFPIAAYGTEQAYEVPWLQRATFVDLAATILTATLQDIETMIVEMLRGLLRNDTYNFDDTVWPGGNAVNLVNVNSGGPIQVCPLANADGSTGSVYAWGTEIALSTLNHYLVSGTANPTIGGFNTMKTKMRAVGNDADLVHVVSRTTADYIVSNFAGTDFFQPVEVLNRYFAQDEFGKYATQNFGLLGQTVRSRGRLSTFGELVEWPHFPDGYAFTYDRTKEPPLRMRESDLAGEQGLGMAPMDPNTPDIQGNPLALKKWRRIFGIGARNRVNGVVMQFTTNGSYAIPTL